VIANGLSNLADESSVFQLETKGLNKAGAAIPFGTIVSRYTGASESPDRDTARLNTFGITPVHRSYPQALGVLSGPRGESLADGKVGSVIRAGLARMKVRVPASLNLAVGTGLVPATVYDTTNNVVLFATSTASANPGVVEPVVWDGVAVEPANPICYLAEALTATGSDSIQWAWVEVDEFHKPLPWAVTVMMNGTIVARTDFAIMRCLGPGIVEGVAVAAGTLGSAGDTDVSIKIAPVADYDGSTTEAKAVMSTEPIIVNDGTDNIMVGTGAAGDGDTDTTTYGLGTSGQGIVLNATKTARQFNTKCLINMTNTAPTAGVDLLVTVHGKYF